MAILAEKWSKAFYLLTYLPYIWQTMPEIMLDHYHKTKMCGFMEGYDLKHFNWGEGGG